MSRARQSMKSATWLIKAHAQGMLSRGLRHLPPTLTDYLIHQFERESSPEELDLAVPSWRVSEIVQSEHVVEQPSSLEVSGLSECLPAERISWSELRVRELHNVTLDIDSGLVFSRDRVLTRPGTSTRSSRDAAFISGAYKRYLRGRNVIQEESNLPVASLGDTWHHYHLLIETFPRALHIRKYFPDVTFVTSDVLSPAAQDVVDLLGLKVHMYPKSCLIAKSPVIVGDQPVKFWPRFTDLMVMKQALNSLTAGADSLGKAFYISRSRSPRALNNEIELEDQLLTAGVTVLYLEDMSFAEQVSTLATASTLIGAHGAGLANMLWMAPKSHLIELSSGDRFESCYRRMAALLDIDYSYVVLTGTEESPYGIVTPSIIEKVKKLVG